MCSSNKKMLVTCALPYANGPIHLGHLLEQIQADIWVRFQRNLKNIVYFICADDAHGTPIMIKARELGISPEKMIKKIKLEHQRDFSAFKISHDNYHSTHSKENYIFSKLIYRRLKKKNLIKEKEVMQFFDQKNNIFLPDRFVKGKCPKCYASNQYGDHCEVCNANYNSIELIQPRSTISNLIPIIKKSKHFFFNIPAFKENQFNWIQSGVLNKVVLNKIKEWFTLGLKEWNISRDSPYFGFKIPKSKNKYFYVWMDAPIGYMSTFKNLCIKKNINFNEFWKLNSKTKLYHFIGKDIIYFHSLFWPSILEGSSFRKPTSIFVHGYVTVNGSKMSKSKGTFIKASTFLSYFDADCLRYYFATKLSSKIEDIDFNIKEFVQKFNSDIVNKVINLASRNAYFINKYFNNYLSPVLGDSSLYQTFINASKPISKYYKILETKKAIKEIMYLADIANQYIEKKSPWFLLKDKSSKKEIHSICSMGIECFRIIMTYLSPVLVSLSEKSEEFLCLKLDWNKINIPMTSHRINNFKTLFKRINIKKVDSMIRNLNST